MEIIDVDGLRFRRYSAEEARTYPEDESLMALRKRVFTLPQPGPSGWFLDLNTHIFLDGRWDFMLLGGPGWSDRGPDWTFTTQHPEFGSVSYNGAESLEYFCATLRNWGCTGMFFCWFDEEPDEFIEAPPFREAFRDVQVVDRLMSWKHECMAFDEKGRFGFYTDDEAMMMIGGPPAFIAEIADRRGGMNSVRSLEDYYWAKQVASWEKAPGNLANTKPYHQLRTQVRRWYRMCRWDNCPV